MLIETQITIDGSKEAIWAVITDIENAVESIQGIEEIEILEKPDQGFVGLKWRETRTVFGKTATEVMWITEAQENESYVARAESHGFVYHSTLRIASEGGGHSLSMSHDSKPQSFMAKLMSIPMALVFKGAMRKLLMKDLQDIKAKVEQ